MQIDSLVNRWYDRLWVILWGIASSIWCLTAAEHLSATFDEWFYLEKGMEAWRTGSLYHLMRAGTMPLPVDVQTLPIYLWEQYRGQPFDVEAESDQLFTIARYGNLVFWWLLLIYGFLLGKRFGGRWAGRMMVAFLACEPSLLGHACLATTDISITAMLFVLLYHFELGRGRSWFYRVALPGCCYGLALLAKASALVFGPLCLMAMEGFRLWQQGQLSRDSSCGWKAYLGHLRRVTCPFRWELLQIVAIGLVVTFSYCGCDWKPQRSFVKWANQLPEGTLHDVMGQVADQLRIFPNAGEALVYQIKHNMRGHGSYLFGEWDKRAIWYYFPTALLLKLTLPMLVLLAGLLFLRPKSFIHPIGLIVLLLLLFSLNCRVQIGVRLIFPLVGFLLLALAIGFTKGMEEGFPRLAQWVYAGFLALCLVPAVSTWPDGLRYFNILWGGPEKGYLYLGDSNYDWGQGLKELNQWQNTHAEKPVQIWYYGTDPRVKRPPFHLLRLHTYPLNGPEDVAATVGPNYLAVSTSILYGNPALNPAWEVALQKLQTMQPIARTSSFFIYDFATCDTP